MGLSGMDCPKLEKSTREGWHGQVKIRTPYVSVMTQMLYATIYLIFTIHSPME
jgi:hypothetical protein